MLLEGLHIPVTTPFSSDGQLNISKLEHNMHRYSKTPAAGLVVLSEVGEPTLLSEMEARQVLQSAIESAAPQKVMIAGVSRDSVAQTLGLAEIAAEFKYDAVLVKVPSILRAYGRTQRTKEVLTYYRAVADRSELPIVLSSGLREHGEMLSVAAVIELASHPQIIGAVDDGAGREWIKEVRAGTMSSREREVLVTSLFGAVTSRMRVAQRGSESGVIAAEALKDGRMVTVAGSAMPAVKTRVKTMGFQVLSGSTDGLLEGLTAGAVGGMPGFAASAPQACYEIFAAWKDDDEGLAREKQERLREVASRVEEELSVPGIKYGCDLNGYFGGRARMPWLPLTGRERGEVEKLMQGLRS